MKRLHFTYHGADYSVDEEGRIKANGLPKHSDGWRFLGASRHHWANSIEIPLREAFRHPELLNGCLGWDLDHGTQRAWRSRSGGKLSRIHSARITEH